MSFCEIEAWCGELVPDDSFFARLHRYGAEWFRDEDFAGIYKDSNLGRPNVPPSLLARALILQNYAGCSDRELVARIRFDLRYKKALDVPIDYTGFHPSLLSHFRARLILDEKDNLVFEKSIQAAVNSGVLKKGDVQAMDSMPVKGAAALQDTYTLLRTQLQKILREVRKQLKSWPKKTPHNFSYPFSWEKYLAEGNIGKPDIPWDDKGAKRKYLGELVSDARTLMGAVRESKLYEQDSVKEALELLERLLGQDVDEDGPDGPKIKKGGEDRVLSTNDPEMRHARKSKSKLIKGYKAHVHTSEKEIVTEIEITSANVHDKEPVEGMLERQRARGVEPERLYGDCHYGDAEFRAIMEKKGIEVVAKIPVASSSKSTLFGKREFELSPDLDQLTCPAKVTTSEYRLRKDEKGRECRAFCFSKKACGGCSLRASCLAKNHSRRWVRLHHHEDQLQKALRQNAEPGFREDFKRRLVVERVQARLQSYGLRQARYFGARRIKLQAFFTAAANNFWRITQLTAVTSRVGPPDLAGVGV